VLHHVALELKPEAVQEEVAFWTALGFAEVPMPEDLGGGVAWVEHAGTQIHLLGVDDPVLPAQGHVAVVVEDFDGVMKDLAGQGLGPVERRRLWGERRAKVSSPAGHVVEFMAAPPAPSAQA
jgi:catechol 2,3-dioxygenase-like lactoylglutathione lyase family enzyme